MTGKLKGGIIGAGKSSFIGYVHIAAASPDRKAEIVAGVFSKDPETLEKLNPDGTSTIYKKGSEALCDNAKMATNLPGGHPEGLICAFANIYRGGFKAIKCLEKNEIPCEKGKPGWDYPDSDQGVPGLAFIEAIIKNNKSSKKWTVLEL